MTDENYKANMVHYLWQTCLEFHYNDLKTIAPESGEPSIAGLSHGSPITRIFQVVPWKMV